MQPSSPLQLFAFCLGVTMMTLYVLHPPKVTCDQQATGYHDIVRVLNTQGAGPWPPFMGHGFKDECLVLDTGTFTPQTLPGELPVRYRYTTSSWLPSFATDMLGQTACWSGTVFLDTDGRIPGLLREMAERKSRCAMQQGDP